MGWLIPIVCAAALSKELLDDFIEENDMDEDNWNFVFVDCIDLAYDDASEPPREIDSRPDSPFIGKSPLECHHLLCKLRDDTESDISTDIFGIMDERSTRDHTALLVQMRRSEDDEDEIAAVETLRATFETSATRLMIWEIGHGSLGEDAEYAAREEDNVFRGF